MSTFETKKRACLFDVARDDVFNDRHELVHRMRQLEHVCWKTSALSERESAERVALTRERSPNQIRDIDGAEQTWLKLLACDEGWQDTFA